MESSALWELLVILVLVLLNGFFAGAEIAVLTARRGRLEQEAERGSRNAVLALNLSGDANRFLATVQVGITMVGTFAAAFGGARVVDTLSRELVTAPAALIAENARGISLVLVSIGIAFVSLVLGELVPKRIALRNAEGLALVVARPMSLLATIARPFVWVLGICTNAVLFLLRSQHAPEKSVSVDDIQHLIETGTAEGVLEPAEQRAALRALRLGERSVREILRPRIDMDALDIEMPPEQVIGAMVAAGFSRVPVYEGDLDHIVGFVYIKDVLRHLYMGHPLEVRRIMRPPLFVPETVTIDRLLELFQEQGTQLAIIVDEYGGTEGMVTLEDVLEELVGDIHDETRQDREQLMVQRDDKSWLVDGTVSLHDLLDRLEDLVPTATPPRGVSTIAGLILHELGRIPNIGDRIEWNGLRIEVVDMDGRRIDRLLVDVPADGKTRGE